MEPKIKSVVLIAVAIILVGSFLVPVIDDLIDDSTISYVNSDKNTAKQIADDDVTITVADGTLSVGTEAVSIVAGPILMSDTLAIYYNGTTFNAFGVVSGSGVQIQNMVGFTTTIDASESTVSVSDVTYSGGTTGAGNTFDDYSWLYHVATEGDYNLVLATATATTYYLESNDQIRGALFASGSLYTTIGDTVYKNGADDSTDTLTFTTNDVAKVDTIRSVTVTNSYTSSGLALNYNSGASNASINWIVVPHEVSEDVESLVSMRAVIAAIPVMLIIAILVGAVGIALKNRY